MAQLKHIDGDYYIASDIGEIIHPLMCDAVAESHRLYVEQMPFNNKSMVIWDVGLGIGSNASAVLHHFCNSPEQFNHNLEIISFDITLEYVELALANHTKFTSLQIEALKALIGNQEWHKEGKSVRWKLTLGDFCKTLKQEAVPDFIMFDPFSKRENPSMWDVELFAQIAIHLGSKPCRLVTYATHPEIRQNLALAGFRVLDGHAVGRRKKSTIAEINCN